MEERSVCLRFELRLPFLSSDIGAFSPGVFRLRAGLTHQASETTLSLEGHQTGGWITPQAFRVLQLGDGKLWNFLEILHKQHEPILIINVNILFVLFLWRTLTNTLSDRMDKQKI